MARMYSIEYQLFKLQIERFFFWTAPIIKNIINIVYLIYTFFCLYREIWISN